MVQSTRNSPSNVACLPFPPLQLKVEVIASHCLNFVLFTVFFFSTVFFFLSLEWKRDKEPLYPDLGCLCTPVT